MLTLLAAAPAWAQTVKVEVSSRSIANDDDLQATFSFSGSGEAKLPELGRDWQTVGQSRGMNTRIINGRMFKEQTVTLVLRPKRTGQLTIPAATIATNGNIVATSQPIQITVRSVAAVAPSQAGNDPQREPRGRFMVVPELERDVYYVGEPFVVTYVLYVQRGTRISMPNIDELKTPDGVQRTDVLEGKIEEEGTPRNFNGTQYARVPVFREVWKVLRPEKLTIPSFRVQVAQAGRGFFNDGSSRQRVKAPPLKFEVRAVPSAGRPANYREGTIGNFKLTAELAPDENQGRALLSVTVDGSGGLETVDPPSVVGISGAEVKPLPSDDKDDVTYDQTGVTGKRSFQYLLTPTRAGTVFVPALKLDFFDPKTGTFKMAQSKALKYVAKQAATRRSAVAKVGQSEDAMVELHPIEADSQLQTVSKTPLYHHWWYWGALCLPFLGFVGLRGTDLVTRRKTAGSGKARRRRAGARAAERISKAKADYAEIAAALHDYVEDKKGLTIRGGSKRQLEGPLAEHWSPDLVAQLLDLLEECDMARFAAGDGGGAGDAPQRAATLLVSLEAGQ